MSDSQCLDGQFFDAVRDQCISCSDVCPPGRDRDKYCVNHCPLTEMSNAQDKDISTSLNTNTILVIFAIVVTAVVVITLIICKKRRRQGAARNVATRSTDESQSVDEPFTQRSTGEPESNTDESIRIGGLPEENADPAATQLVPNGTELNVINSHTIKISVAL